MWKNPKLTFIFILLVFPSTVLSMDPSSAVAIATGLADLGPIVMKPLNTVLQPWYNTDVTGKHIYSASNGACIAAMFDINYDSVVYNYIIRSVRYVTGTGESYLPVHGDTLCPSNAIHLWRKVGRQLTFGVGYHCMSCMSGINGKCVISRCKGAAEQQFELVVNQRQHKTNPKYAFIRIKSIAHKDSCLEMVPTSDSVDFTFGFFGNIYPLHNYVVLRVCDSKKDAQLFFVDLSDL